MPIDSDSTGDPRRHPTFAELEARFAALAPAPTDVGTVRLIVARYDGGRRHTLDAVPLAPDAGLPGDAWARRPRRDADMSIAVMQVDVATLLANGQPLELFGDNLFLDLDLSVGNLPPGSRVRIGTVSLRVTPAPHNGCRKFRARFGDDALRFISGPERRERNMRGIYLRVVTAGTITRGDRVEVLARADR